MCSLEELKFRFLIQVLHFFTKVRVCSGTLSLYLALTTFATFFFKSCIPACVFLAIFFRILFLLLNIGLSKNAEPSCEVRISFRLKSTYELAFVSCRTTRKLGGLVLFPVYKFLLVVVFNSLFSPRTPRIYHHLPCLLKYISF